MTANHRLHDAVETMTEDEAVAALRTLAQASGDPVVWIFDHAPLDDETETDEEQQAVAAARADRERGVDPVRLEDVLAEFGGARPTCTGASSMTVPARISAGSIHRIAISELVDRLARRVEDALTLIISYDWSGDERGIAHRLAPEHSVRRASL